MDNFEQTINDFVPEFGNQSHIKALELIKKVKTKSGREDERLIWKDQILKLIK